jgi:hypothetical protein
MTYNYDNRLTGYREVEMEELLISGATVTPRE